MNVMFASLMRPGLGGSHVLCAVPCTGLDFSTLEVASMSVFVNEVSSSN